MNHKSLRPLKRDHALFKCSRNQECLVVLLFLSVCLLSAGTVENETLDMKAKESFFPSFKTVLLWLLFMLLGWNLCM